MKHFTASLAISAGILGAVMCGLTACDTMWGTSVDVGGSPDDYYYGWDGEWLPTLAGAPLISPYYYGGSAYPVGNWRPLPRPGQGPFGNPVNPVPVPPSRPNIPVGNVRPGQPTPSTPSVPGNRPVAIPDHPINIGSNPGIQLPPAGSGFHYTPPENAGRH